MVRKHLSFPLGVVPHQCKPWATLKIEGLRTPGDGCPYDFYWKLFQASAGGTVKSIPYESQFKFIPEGDTTTAKGDFISHREISSQRDFIRYKRISLRL